MEIVIVVMLLQFGSMGQISHTQKDGHSREIKNAVSFAGSLRETVWVWCPLRVTSSRFRPAAVDATGEARLNLCSMSHSYAQIEELLTLLKSLPAEQGAMTPGELEGYVTGLIVCPETIPLFEWQPPVWGDEGAVPFGGLWKAEVASRIVADHYNRISESLFYGSEQYVPLYEVDDESDEPLWEPWISGFERAMRLRPDAWERVVDSGETEAAASVNMILALYDIGQGQSDLAEEAIEEMDSIALDLIPGFVQTLYVRLASRQSGSNATTETEGEGAFGSNVILFPSRKAGRDARCP